MAHPGPTDISHALSADNEAEIDAAQNASLPLSDEDELKQPIQQNQTPQQYSQQQQRQGTPPPPSKFKQRKLARRKSKNTSSSYKSQQQHTQSDIPLIQSTLQGYDASQRYEEPANSHDSDFTFAQDMEYQGQDWQKEALDADNPLVQEVQNEFTCPSQFKYNASQGFAQKDLKDKNNNLNNKINNKIHNNFNTK